MEYLFTEKNLSVLKSFSIVDTLYAFDFDGTISPIVDLPDEAYLPDTISEKLFFINDMASIAIITGRSLKDIKNKLTFNPKYLIGNHGIEYLDNLDNLKQMSDLCLEWLTIINRHDLETINKLGIVVENKKYTLSFHYRNSKDVLLAEDVILKLVSELTDSKIVKGKCVINVVPACGMNKGEALKKLLQENKYRFCIYVGDDVTDEDVFNIQMPDLLTIKIGNDKNSKAKYYLNEFSEVERLLEYILDFNKN